MLQKILQFCSKSHINCADRALDPIRLLLFVRQCRTLHHLSAREIAVAEFKHGPARQALEKRIQITLDEILDRGKAKVSYNTHEERLGQKT